MTDTCNNYYNYYDITSILMEVHCLFCSDLFLPFIVVFKWYCTHTHTCTQCIHVVTCTSIILEVEKEDKKQNPERWNDIRCGVYCVSDIIRFMMFYQSPSKTTKLTLLTCPALAKVVCTFTATKYTQQRLHLYTQSTCKVDVFTYTHATMVTPSISTSLKVVNVHSLVEYTDPEH